MNLPDFIAAIQAIFLLRLKIDEWEAANLMRNNMSMIERHFHEGAAPIETVSVLIGRDLPEYYGAPDGSNIFGGT
jgi:hypothetical protein